MSKVGATAENVFFSKVDSRGFAGASAAKRTALPSVGKK
jgi:hypothetical protein